MAEQRYFEDIDVGDEFTEEQQPTREHVEQFFNISRLDGRPSRAEAGDGRFTSTESARELGLERPIVPGTMSMAMITRLVTDWMGPDGTLKAFSVRYRDMDVPGDTLTCTATVVEKDDEAGTVRCEIALTNGAGKTTTTGDAVVALPQG